MSSRFAQLFQRASAKLPDREEEDFVNVWRKVEQEAEERRSASGLSAKSVLSIPKFYFKQVQRTELGLMSADLARELFLEIKEQEYDFLSRCTDQMWQLLNERCPDGWLGYDDFMATQAPAMCSRYYTPEVFLRFSANEQGKIRLTAFFEYMNHTMNTIHNIITISRYDTHGQGYLMEHELENYVFETITAQKAFEEMEESFRPYYVFHCVRKMMFFVDPLRKISSRGIRVVDLVTSEPFQEFNQQVHEVPVANWFSLENAKRLYRLYLKIDSDNNGLLSTREIANLYNNSLSNLFIQSLYQTKRTFDGELDYKGFLDLTIAMENKTSKAALHYFWPILDIEGCGYLTPLSVHALFRSVRRKMAIFSNVDVEIRFEDIVSEIFDMTKPRIPDRITLQDLIDCGVAINVIDVLTSVDGFLRYEGRDDKTQQEE